MGTRVHVVKKQAEYGSTAGFNWKSEEFRSLLDATGANTSGEDYSYDYECEVENYKKSLKVIARLARKSAMFEKYGEDKYNDRDKLDALLEEFDLDDYDSIASQVNELGGAKLVLEYMVGFYTERDRDSDWISFSAF